MNPIKTIKTINECNEFRQPAVYLHTRTPDEVTKVLVSEYVCARHGIESPCVQLSLGNHDEFVSIHIAPETARDLAAQLIEACAQTQGVSYEEWHQTEPPKIELKIWARKKS